MKIPSANKVRQVTDKVKEEEIAEQNRKEREKRKTMEGFKKVQIQKALEYLEENSAAIITEAANKGLNVCKLEPLESYSFYDIIMDKAFEPFIKQLEKSGYTVKIMQDKHVCRSSDACWDGYTTYTAYIEVRW